MYILCLLILFHLNLYVTFLVLHDYLYYLYYTLVYLFLHRSGWVYAASIAVNRYLTSTILHEYPLPLSWVTVWYLCLVNRYLTSTILHESVFSLLFMTECYLFCHQSAFCFCCIWIYNVSYCNLPVCYLYCTIILFYIISPVVYLLDTISLLSIHI